jgi:hypothetical protein
VSRGPARTAELHCFGERVEQVSDDLVGLRFDLAFAVAAQDVAVAA